MEVVQQKSSRSRGRDRQHARGLRSPENLYLWRKLAEPRWLGIHGYNLQVYAQGTLAVISRPAHKRLQLEIACTSPRAALALVKQFGGRTEKLPRDWLKRFKRAEESKAIKIGKRLVISNVGGTLASRLSRRSHILVPASMAFGTGEHATTAMSLRLLEQLTREWKNSWSLVDLGTGSGILALAAKRFGAGRVAGVDIDPTAISIAKANARLNKIGDVEFQLEDLRKWKPAYKIDIVTANLYSQLLVEILPTLKRSTWLILSGILRTQEKEFARALSRSKIDIVEVRRRGKWIAVLAKTHLTGDTANG